MTACFAWPHTAAMGSLACLCREHLSWVAFRLPRSVGTACAAPRVSPYAPLVRPDGTYDVGDISADTLRTVLDFCYTGALPKDLPLASFPHLLRAAHRLLMPQLQLACRVRLAAAVASGAACDEALLSVYVAAAEIGDERVAGLVRRFLVGSGRGRAWLEGIVSDAEAWRRLVVAPEEAQQQEGSAAAAAAGAALRELLARVLRGEGGAAAADIGVGEKRKRGH